MFRRESYRPQKMVIMVMVNEHSEPPTQFIVNQGDVYWVQLPEHGGSSAVGYAHPYVVIQENVLNHSRLNTVVICALTSNMKRSSWPGNILLEAGEANLPRESVVEVSKVNAVEKAQLGDYIGSLTGQRVNQILAGMRLQQNTHFGRQSEGSVGESHEQQPGGRFSDD